MKIKYTAKNCINRVETVPPTKGESVHRSRRIQDPATHKILSQSKQWRQQRKLGISLMMEDKSSVHTESINNKQDIVTQSQTNIIIIKSWG